MSIENIQKIYNSNIKHILGGNEDYFKNLRQDLVSNFILNKKLIKNNESLKNIDKNVLNNLSFRTTSTTLNHQHFTNEDLDSSIVIKNGSNYDFINLDDNKAIVNPLSSDLGLLINRLEKNKDLLKDDYIVNLNSILLNSGFDFSLNENQNLKVIIIHKNDQNESTIFAKNFLNIKKNSKLLIIEKFLNNVSSNSNIINYFELEEGSELLHLVIQNNTNDCSLQFTTHTTCHKSSKFNQLIFNLSDNSLRNHHYASLMGEHAESNLRGLFFSGKKNIVDNKTTVNHFSHSCSSNQIYKGILTDEAKASYLSKTYVDKQAQKTDGYQLSKGILLSKDAYFHSKPELKIYADDVKCSHGSTIGPFDDDEIFYLRTRGLNIKAARTLLIRAFCYDFLRSIGEDSYVNEVNKLINEWLLKNLR